MFSGTGRGVGTRIAAAQHAAQLLSLFKNQQ